MFCAVLRINNGHFVILMANSSYVAIVIELNLNKSRASGVEKFATLSNTGSPINAQNGGNKMFTVCA